MKKTQIESRIIDLVTNYKSFTLFLLKQEFGTRQHKEVADAVARLEAAGKIHRGPDMFLKIGPAIAEKP